MADEFSREISRVIVGQLAEVAGYESVQDSAAEVLGELLIKYITELSASSHGYAELANRTAINVHDILLGLDDLGTSVPELQTYLSCLTPEDNTFAHPLPPYPIQKPGRKLPTFQDKREAPPPHIPAFLPAFPDKHTYVRTPKFSGHEEDPAKQTQLIQQARRQAEKSLIKLHYNLTHPDEQNRAPQAAGPSGSSAGAGAPAPADPSSLPTTAPTASTNPFLAPPTTVVAPPGTTQAQMPWFGGSQLGGAASRGQAFVPDAALHAFKAVLPAEATGGAAQGTLDQGDVVAGEEDLELKQEDPVYREGVQREPLGSMLDYPTKAYNAAQAVASGRAPEDAYEKAAAKSSLGVPDAGTSSGRETRQPKKHPAEEILAARSLDVDRAMEGEDE